MKDCKWNPPTAGTKGIHVSPDGEILDRAALNDVEESTVLLKLVDASGKSKTRRAASRQIEQWQKDGTLARFISGELDPPGNWVRHVRWRELDTTTGSSHGLSSNATGKLITGEDLVPRAVDALFLDAYEGGYYGDSPEYAEDHDTTRSAVLRAALTSLMREGRLKREELSEVNKRTTSFVAALHNAKVINRAFALHPSPTTATELAVRHGSFLFQLDPNNPDDVKKAELLCHARTSFDNPSWASLVDPSELLNHAFNSQTSADTLTDITTRLHTISQSAGSLMLNFNTLGTGERAHSQQREALELLSVLHDPVDQRALAIVIATAATYASGVPSGLARTAPRLPDGVSDLDRLTRAVAVGLKEGRIHGEPEHAARLALDLLAGRDLPTDTTIASESDWAYGALGVLSLRSVTNRTRQDATVSELLRQTSKSLDHWDTIVLSKNPDPREVLAAVALRQARRNGGNYDGMALGRMNAIAGENQSLRSIADTAVQQATGSALPEDISATLALALISDAKHGKPSRELIDALDVFTATGRAPKVRNYVDLPATTVISDLIEMYERTAQAPSPAATPAAIRPELPPLADKLCAQLRTQVSSRFYPEVGSIADAYAGEHGPHFERALHVPFASDVNVPALIAHVSDALERAPRRNSSGGQGAGQSFPPMITIRENELLITHDSAIDGRTAVLESLLTENSNPRSALLTAPRVKLVADPEFARLLREEEAAFPTPAPDREAQRRAAESEAAFAAGKDDPEFEQLLKEG